jgi:hypothetical protein
MRSKPITSTNERYPEAVNKKYIETRSYNDLQQDVQDVYTYGTFKTVTFANPLVLDASLQKDFICSAVSASTTINLVNVTDGDGGMIELIISGAGGYTLTLGSMFTKDLAGNAFVATTAADNFISWRKIGSNIVYSISQVQ